jgi:hypothetical protein
MPSGVEASHSAEDGGGKAKNFAFAQNDEGMALRKVAAVCSEGEESAVISTAAWRAK